MISGPRGFCTLIAFDKSKGEVTVRYEDGKYAVVAKGLLRGTRNPLEVGSALRLMEQRQEREKRGDARTKQ